MDDLQKPLANEYANPENTKSIRCLICSIRQLPVISRQESACTRETSVTPKRELVDKLEHTRFVVFTPDAHDVVIRRKCTTFSHEHLCLWYRRIGAPLIDIINQQSPLEAQLLTSAFPLNVRISLKYAKTCDSSS